MNVYRFDVQEYMTEAGHLSLVEHGALRRLMDLYLSQEGPLELDNAALHRRLGARTSADIAAVDLVLKCFFRRTEHGWRSSRCDALIKKYQHRAAINRINGLKGGRTPDFVRSTRNKT